VFPVGLTASAIAAGDPMNACRSPGRPSSREDELSPFRRARHVAQHEQARDRLLGPTRTRELVFATTATLGFAGRERGR